MANELQFKIVFDTSTGVASIKNVNDELTKLSNDTKSATKGIQESLASAFMPLSTLKESIGAITGTFKNLFSGFITYETSIMRIANVSNEFASNVDNIKSSLKGLISKVPVQSMDELTDAYRRAAGMSYSVADSFKLTELSAKAALGTYGSTTDSMNALVSVMGAYNQTASASNSTMDILVTLANRTGQSMSDIGSAFGVLAPMASAVGISFTDLASTISTMTKTGLPMDKVVQRLSMVLPRLSQVLSKTLGDGTLQARGLTESLYELGKSSSGFDELSKQTGKFGVLLVQSITKNYKLAKTEADAFNNSIGATDESFKRQSGTLANQLAKLTVNIKQIKNSAIAALAPVFRSLTEVIVGFITKLKETPKWFQQLISVSTVLLPALIAIKVTGLSGIITSMGGMIVSMVSATGITNSFTVALAGSTMGAKALQMALAVGVIGAVVGLIYFLPDIIKFFNVLSGDSKINFDNLINESTKAGNSLSNFENTMKPLADRFDELNNKTKLTAAEQKELEKITAELVKAYPELAVGIDQTTGQYILNNNAMGMGATIREKLVATIDKEIQSLGKAYLAYRYMIPAEKEAVKALGGVMGFFKNLVGIESTDQITESQKRMDSAFKTSIEIYVKSLDKVDLTTKGVQDIIGKFTNTSHISLSQLNDDHINYAKSLLVARKSELENLSSLDDGGLGAKESKTGGAAQTTKKEFDELLKTELELWKTRYDLREISIAKFTIETNKLYEQLIKNDKYNDLIKKQKEGTISNDELVTLVKYQKLKSDIISTQNKELEESFKIADDLEKERLQNLKDKQEQDLKYREEYAKDIAKIESDIDEAERVRDEEKLKRLEVYAGYVKGFMDSIGKAFETGINFTNMIEGMKQGFKGILIQLINFLEAKWIIAEISSILDAVITPLAVLNLVGLVAAGTAMEAVKAMVSSFATGGLITKPTLALMGESGQELVAPKKDFLTVARELIATERMQPQLVQSGSGQRVYIQLNGKFESAGRTMIATIDQENYYQAKRRL